MGEKPTTYTPLFVRLDQQVQLRRIFQTRWLFVGLVKDTCEIGFQLLLTDRNSNNAPLFVTEAPVISMRLTIVSLFVTRHLAF